ncbi:hypothetical protein HMPREF9517_00815 [Enterococcus faecalis TX1341]|nr:hypothetical protein HMPREF9517_00815 [Enterococcus faecalis TX1341]EGO8645112.1 hypothetical protein [Enterococcus faecalis]EGO9409063.1 hypothetical protein [Enterococcus faecalis]EGS8308795.1 hypothetical protein [Enterococcus faecalis]EHM3167816.1 hypothetical protein [Enterococcus faecalis]
MDHLVLILFHAIMKTTVLAYGRINYEMGISMLELEKRIAELDPFMTSLFVDFLYGRTLFKEFEPHSDDILLFAKLNYKYQTFLIGTNEEHEDIFFWKNNYVKIWCIGIGSPEIGHNDLLFFASCADTDKIKIVDCVEATTTPAFYKLDAAGKIKFLIAQKCIPDISDTIIKNSIVNSPSVEFFIKKWTANEKKTIDTLISTPASLTDFNKMTLRAKRYNFEEMLQTINNKQFEIEFDECLYCYNNQKWFVCAAGLGSILEHLLYLILEKNKMIDSNFPDDATAKIYIEYMSRKPISIKKRERTNLKTLFLIRNSVSHYNQGFTSKQQCAFLMDGIKDVFNNYYVKDFNLDNN